tara:strand:- start:285 stop:548 length:264 start_codon:yes stop_codon:yes gene_type:complete
MSKIKEKGMEVQQLFDTLESQLGSHDWFYNYSDDSRYYKTGQREHMQIWNTIESLSLKGENEFDRAIDMYRKAKPVVSAPHETRITK